MRRDALDGGFGLGEALPAVGGVTPSAEQLAGMDATLHELAAQYEPWRAWVCDGALGEQLKEVHTAPHFTGHVP